MKPQKRSIRDFFAPVARSSQDSSQDDPRPTNASPTIASASPSSVPSIAPTSTTSNVVSRPALTNPDVRPTASDPIAAEVQPPTTSQASANSGASKRTVSRGEQVVLNSDSDSDSLPDLDWGEPLSSIKTSKPITRSKRAADSDEDGLRKPEKKGRNKKLSLLVETAQKNIQLEQKILEHKADLEKPLEEPAPAEFTLNEDILGQAVQDDDDSDRAHRLFLAMQRTKATQKDNVFSLFTNIDNCISLHPKFPSDSLPTCKWAHCLKDHSNRDMAFMTGFAHQIFKSQELPEELASWMIDQICVTQNETLSLKYLEILEAHDQYLHTLLDSNRLNSIFSSLGADVQHFNDDSEIVRTFDTQSASLPRLPPALKSVARLLERAAPWLRSKSRIHALHLLLYFTLDHQVSTNVDVLGSVQDAIEATLCNFADNHKLNKGLSHVLPDLLLRIKDPVMQRDLVCALPSRSPLTAYLQRHMAMAFLLYPTTLDVPLADTQVLDLVHKHLETAPGFRIKKATDYSALAARLTLLDIAIGPGLLSVPYQPLISPPRSPEGSSPISPPVPQSHEIKMFNNAVDNLAQHIKLVGNSIVESGASVDLTILDAKDCVERLSARLEHAVRIGGKKAHNVFGNEEEDKQLRVTDLFRKAAKAKRVPSSGIFDDEDDNDSDGASAQIQAESLRGR